MKHSPCSLHLEHLASEAGLIVLHTETHMYLSSRSLKLLGTVFADSLNGELHYLCAAPGIPIRTYDMIWRLSKRARTRATISNNHTPSTTIPCTPTLPTSS